MCALSGAFGPPQTLQCVSNLTVISHEDQTCLFSGSADPPSHLALPQYLIKVQEVKMGGGIRGMERRVKCPAVCARPSLLASARCSLRKAAI